MSNAPVRYIVLHYSATYADQDLGVDVWRTIPAAPDYQVSNTGRVRRSTIGKRGHKPKVLKNSRDRNGYAVVNLSLPGGGQAKFYVHRLVAEAFIPNPEGKPQVAHWDGDGMNARAGNLRWVEQKKNEADKHRHGRANYSRHRGSRTFTAEQIAGIQREISRGQSVNRVARRQGVSHATVTNALRNGAWGASA